MAQQELSRMESFQTHMLLHRLHSRLLPALDSQQVQRIPIGGVKL